MDSFLQVTAADEAQQKLARNKAAIKASTRYQQELGKFISASTDEADLDSRLYLVEDEVRGIVTAACDEEGYDGIPELTASILMTARQRFADSDSTDESSDDTVEESNRPWENKDSEEDEEKVSRVAASSEGTAIPKMDKRKWTPRNVGEVPKDKADGPNPTVQQDVNQQDRPVNTDEHDLDQIGEGGTLKREDVTKKVTEQKGDHTKVYPKGNQANPVTAAGVPGPGINPGTFGEDEGRGMMQDVGHPDADGANLEQIKHYVDQNFPGGVQQFITAIGGDDAANAPTGQPGQDPTLPTHPETQFPAPPAGIQSSTDDAYKNPVREMLNSGFDGFVPQTEVDRAISLHNAS